MEESTILKSEKFYILAVMEQSISGKSSDIVVEKISIDIPF